MSRTHTYFAASMFWQAGTWIAVGGSLAIVLFISGMGVWYVRSVQWEKTRGQAVMKEYAPRMFAHIRSMLNIDTADDVDQLMENDSALLSCFPEGEGI